ncbi:MAG: zinc-ribbon domain-containing protein, partial [Magnetococcales bacterium]|nr:zinc-ribbon domain-containing protein [Magnetococcales bacterium]
MLALRNPHLLKEWHKEKNGKWTPFNTTYCSNRKIWWRCEFGHEWISTANNRHNGNGCPYCSGTLTLPEKSFAVRF